LDPGRRSQFFLAAFEVSMLINIYVDRDLANMDLLPQVFPYDKRKEFSLTQALFLWNFLLRILMLKLYTKAKMTLVQ
jgi:hypothetical protein